MNKQQRVNIFVGRFQPFTSGHEKVLKELYKANGLGTVLLVISNKKFDGTHPFSDDLIYRQINGTIGSKEYYVDTLYIQSADIVKFVSLLRSEGYEPVLWGCGTDRIQTYTKMVNRYGEKLDLQGDFGLFEITRGDDDISATKVRNAIKDGDVRTYTRMMPDGADMYFDDFRDALHKIYECGDDIYINTYNNTPMYTRNNNRYINRYYNNKTEDTITEDADVSYDTIIEELKQYRDSDVPVSEGVIKAIIGGLTGAAIGPAITKAICKVLGIDVNGQFGKLITSRLVTTALGYEIGLNK